MAVEKQHESWRSVAAQVLASEGAKNPTRQQVTDKVRELRRDESQRKLQAEYDRYNGPRGISAA